MDRALINEQGKHIGWVEDLLINPKDNQGEKIIVSSGHLMGEDTYAALPYHPLGFTAYGLVYEMTPKELQGFVYPYEE